MAGDPILIDENTSIMKAIQLMKEHRIRRIPVVKQNRIVGIVSDRDVKEAAPSKATSLDVHELYYLLSEIKVKDIMTPNPITLRENDSVERAAVIMLENRISGLPVINDNQQVVGMITQTDVFKTMISMSGVYRSPIQIACELEYHPGYLNQLLNIILANHDARVVSVLSSTEHVSAGRREVYIRIKNMPEDKLNLLVADLEKHFKVLYVHYDDFSNIPRKQPKDLD